MTMKRSNPTEGFVAGERSLLVRTAWLVLCVVLAAFIFASMPGVATATASGTSAGEHAQRDGTSWSDYLPGSVLGVLLFLLALSAFFSSCETAFLSIPKTRLRGMRDEEALTARWVARMLDNPGRLLTTILVGNMLVNTLVGVVLGTRVKDYFESGLAIPAYAAYPAAIGVTTAMLLFFGEITPKVFAVRAQESYARIVVVPLMLADGILAPLRSGLLKVTEFLFRVTRFHELHAAPFITDDELKSALSEDQTRGVIEDDERMMIQGILDVQDVQLREILIPRPDVVGLEEDATVREAHELFQEHEYSRMPIYVDDLDHITGILFSKDLLASLAKGLSDQPVKAIARPPHFVPEVMTVKAFIKDVQRLRSHLAVVVDEFGGTEGIVTLHDAIELVVGDIQDEGYDEQPEYEDIGDGIYRVNGGFSLEDLSDLVHVPIEDEEHNTLTGFLMHKMEKMPCVGDQLSHLGVKFTVEQVEKMRASVVRVELEQDVHGDSEDADAGGSAK